MVGMITSIIAMMLPIAAVSASASAGQAQPVVAGGLAPSNYTADGTPIYHLTNRVAQPLATAHACSAPGNDGVTQAVFCADAFGASNGNGTATVTPQSEGMCQTLSNRNNFPRCANIHESFALWSAGPVLRSPTYVVDCGHNGTLCPVPRSAATGPGFAFGGCLELWTVVNGGSVIELPASARNVALPASLSSGHIIVCA